MVSDVIDRNGRLQEITDRLTGHDGQPALATPGPVRDAARATAGAADPS
ncbi:hypothetical protein ACFV4F_19490 [Kitasatospora sp. NPDC059722]